MIWVLVCAVCVFLAIKFRGFRYSLLIIAGLLVLIIAGYFFRQQASEKASMRLVSADQLQFSDLRLGPSNYGSSYSLVGRVKNTSAHTVFSLTARIRISDCDDSGHCETVGDQNEYIGILLPPGQVRDMNETVYFGNATKIRGHFEWNYSITEIRARD